DVGLWSRLDCLGSGGLLTPRQNLGARERDGLPSEGVPPNECRRNDQGSTALSYFSDNYSRLRLPIEIGTLKGLRPAQLAAAQAIAAHFFSRTEPAIVVMPTGSGKTCVMLLA